MIPDPFTTAARAEAEDWIGMDSDDHDNFVAGAEWARDHLAAQEPTHEAVMAATLELYARAHHSTGRQTPFERLDHEEQVSWVEDGRAVLEAALTTAKEARS